MSVISKIGSVMQAVNDAVTGVVDAVGGNRRGELRELTVNLSIPKSNYTREESQERRMIKMGIIRSLNIKNLTWQSPEVGKSFETIQMIDINKGEMCKRLANISPDTLRRLDVSDGAVLKIKKDLGCK